MQVRWDQGQDRAGSQTHHKVTIESHLKTHLSKSEWTLMSKQSKTKKKTQWDAETLSTTKPHNHNHTSTHTHTPSAPGRLSRLYTQHLVISQSMFGFSQTANMSGGGGPKGSAARAKGRTRGWVETMLCGTWTRSNLEIFFWPRVKRMILLCDESLEDALHDMQIEFSWTNWEDRAAREGR